MPVQPSVWLDLMRREYLRRFVTGGGSAIKFVMGNEAELATIARDLRDIAQEKPLHIVDIDAAVTKIHMIQDVFFAISLA